MGRMSRRYVRAARLAKLIVVFIARLVEKGATQQTSMRMAVKEDRRRRDLLDPAPPSCSDLPSRRKPR